MLRLIGIRATGAREVVDRAADLGEALDLARLYLTDPRDNWQTIQVWDEAPNAAGGSPATRQCAAPGADPDPLYAPFARPGLL